MRLRSPDSPIRGAAGLAGAPNLFRRSQIRHRESNVILRVRDLTPVPAAVKLHATHSGAAQILELSLKPEGRVLIGLVM